MLLLCLTECYFVQKKYWMLLNEIKYVQKYKVPVRTNKQPFENTKLKRSGKEKKYRFDSVMFISRYI